MVILKQRLHRLNTAGEYDTIRLETSSDLVIRPDGSNVEAAISSITNTINSGTVNYANGAGNANTLGGRGSGDFVWHVGRNITVDELNNPNFPFPYVASWHDGTNLGLPAGWWHIQYYRHMDNNGFGTQIAYPLETSAAGTFSPRYRYSSGVNWLPWYEIYNNTPNSLANLKGALGISSNSSVSGGNGSISGTTTVGGTMTFDNFRWIVVDDGVRNANEKVIMMESILLLDGYWNMFEWCNAFWNHVLSPEARAKCTPHHVTELGTYAYRLPVFLATYTEANGGFAYLNSNANRIGKYNNIATAWWTSTPHGGSGVYSVRADGTINEYSGGGDAYGFRPFIALKR